MPEAEVRRQKGARRKGVVLGLIIAVVLLLGYTVIGPLIIDLREAHLARTTIQRVDAAYRELTTYRDTFESTVEIGVGGVSVPVRGSGSIIFHRPEKFDLALHSEFSTPETEVRIASDGKVLAIIAPDWRQFKVMPIAESSPQFYLSGALASHIGPMRVLPVYQMLLSPANLGRFVRDASNVRYEGPAELNGERVRVFSWEHAAAPIIEAAGLAAPVSGEARVPVRAWISVGNSRVLQIRLDLSRWAKQLTGDPREVNITGLMLTESHKTIETSTEPPPPVRFQLAPPPGSMPVSEFSVPRHRASTLAFLKLQFSRMIPQRFSAAPPNLVDLSDYYNAPLSKTWHPGMANNTLEALPTGLLQFGTVFFDVRGVVQLSGKQLEKAGGRYPQGILGIKIGQTCRELHFLHASGWRTKDGTRIGSYILHYANGAEQVIPIVYGEDVRDWVEQSDPSTNLRRANLVWKVINSAGVHIRLFKTSWVNQFPDVEITSMDYVSAMADAAPFLIALTAER